MVVPSPSSECTSTVPPICSMLVRTTSIPTPRPETLVTVSAVEKPGGEDQVDRPRGRYIRAACSAVMTPLSTALAAIALAGRCRAPSSEISMLTWPPSWKARRARRALGGLARGLARLRGLDAVVDGVADEVGQRVLDGLEDGLVELGVVAVASRARPPCRTDGPGRGRPAGNLDHTFSIGCMRVFMTPSCSSVVMRLSRCAVRDQGASSVSCGELQDLVAGQHELADQVHQRVEQVDVDADGGVGDARRRALRGQHVDDVLGP